MNPSLRAQHHSKPLFHWIYRLLRGCLGIIFIYAGGLKLADPQTFAVLIEAYGIAPEPLLLPIAVALPALEVAAGVGLLFDVQGSLEVIAGLLVLFIAILAYGIWMGLDVDCGCFGPNDPEAKAFHGLRTSLYRDLAMLGAILIMYVWRRLSGVQTVKFTHLIQNRFRKRRKENAYV